MTTTRLTLSLNLDNDAFLDEDGNLDHARVADQLRSVASQVEEGAWVRAILDLNGDRVGVWHIGEANGAV